jgi:hypothetical protein
VWLSKTLAIVDIGSRYHVAHNNITRDLGALDLVAPLAFGPKGVVAVEIELGRERSLRCGVWSLSHQARAQLRRFEGDQIAMR